MGNYTRKKWIPTHIKKSLYKQKRIDPTYMPHDYYTVYWSNIFYSTMLTLGEKNEVKDIFLSST